MVEVTDQEREAFVKGYVEAALWTAVNYETGEPLDAHYEVEDFSETALAKMREDCDDFLSSFGEIVRGLDYAFGNGMTAEHVFNAAGHDFLLTRQGHGAGFWDRGLGEIGDYLTEMSKPYGDLHVWADGTGYGTLEVE